VMAYRHRQEGAGPIAPRPHPPCERRSRRLARIWTTSVVAAATRLGIASAAAAEPTFRSHEIQPGPLPTPQRIALADLGGDGRVAVPSLTTDGGLVAVPIGGHRFGLARDPDAFGRDGEGMFTEVVEMVPGDLDADGDVDVVLAGRIRDGIVVLHDDGEGGLHPVRELAPGEELGREPFRMPAATIPVVNGAASPGTADPGPRRLRPMSFGISKGRELDPGRIGRTREDLPPLPAPGEPPSFDPRTWFDDPGRPFEIEIGSGKGTFLVQQAAIDPGTNFLGIEHAGEFARHAADRLRRHGLENVRLLWGDAVDLIRYRVRSGVVDVIHLYYSDPWPKSRHHKRRVVQRDSLRAFHRVLVPGGRLHLVTDHAELWDWYLEHVAWAEAEGLFTRTEFVPPTSAREGELVGTNYERKFVAEGRAKHAMTLVRADAAG